MSDALREAVEYEVRYETPDEKGECRWERHLRFKQPIPPAPDLPACATHVWGWFWVLSAQRHSGPEAISYAEIEAWARLTGVSPTPHEVALLMAMDIAWMHAMNVEIKAHRERQIEASKAKTGKGKGRKGK